MDLAEVQPSNFDGLMARGCSSMCSSSLVAYTVSLSVATSPNVELFSSSVLVSHMSCLCGHTSNPELSATALSVEQRVFV